MHKAPLRTGPASSGAGKAPRRLSLDEVHLEASLDLLAVFGLENGRPRHLAPRRRLSSAGPRACQRPSVQSGRWSFAQMGSTWVRVDFGRGLGG